MQNKNISASEALEKLKAANQRYLSAAANPGDISLEIRRETCQNGQYPYAIVVACSDSRVIPEDIFMAGIGELFVIRVAGNVLDNHQLGSIEYAIGHLGCRLVLILGHDHCGAVDAALNHKTDGYVKYITDEIKRAIGEEKDQYRASCLNVERSVFIVKDSLHIQETADGPKVQGAIYHIDSGAVEFLQ